MTGEMEARRLDPPRFDVDGRRVIDELPDRLAVGETEIELVSQHMHAIVAAMFGDAVEDEE